MLLVWFLNVTAVWCRWRDGSPCWNAMFAFPHTYRGRPRPKHAAVRADAVTVSRFLHTSDEINSCFTYKEMLSTVARVTLRSLIWALLLTSWMFVHSWKQAVLAAHMNVLHFLMWRRSRGAFFIWELPLIVIQTQECDRHQSEITYYIWCDHRLDSLLYIYLAGVVVLSFLILLRLVCSN